MRRALITAALAAAALAAAATAAPPPASVKLVGSARLEDASRRPFYGRMQQVPGASRMAMRFTLLEETGGDSAVAREGPRPPALASLEARREGVRVPPGLPEPARERAATACASTSAGMRATAARSPRAKRRSARCRQFVALPNLQTRLTGVSPTKVGGVVRYEGSVMNTGKAGRDRRARAPDRRRQGRRHAARSPRSRPAGGARSPSAGPSAHGVVRLEADPEKSIAESSDADNASELTCAALRNIG